MEYVAKNLGFVGDAVDGILNALMTDSLPGSAFYSSHFVLCSQFLLSRMFILSHFDILLQQTPQSANNSDRCAMPSVTCTLILLKYFPSWDARLLVCSPVLLCIHWPLRLISIPSIHQPCACDTLCCWPYWRLAWFGIFCYPQLITTQSSRTVKQHVHWLLYPRFGWSNFPSKRYESYISRSSRTLQMMLRSVPRKATRRHLTPYCCAIRGVSMHIWTSFRLVPV